MSDQELVTTEENLPSVIPPLPDEFAGEGMEEFQREDRIIPRYQRKENLSKFDPEGKVPAGHFWQNITQESKEQIKAVFLKFKHGRAYFNKKGQLVCASDNGRVAREQFKDGPFTRCRNCPNAKWGTDREPPACSASYNFLGIERMPGLPPFMLSLRGQSFKHAKRFVNEVFVDPRYRKTLYAVPVIISSVGPIEGNLGSWYETVITIDKDALVNFDWRPYRTLFMELKESAPTGDEDGEVEDDTNELKDIEGEDDEIPF